LRSKTVTGPRHPSGAGAVEAGRRPWRREHLSLDVHFRDHRVLNLQQRPPSAEARLPKSDIFSAARLVPVPGVRVPVTRRVVRHRLGDGRAQTDRPTSWYEDVRRWREGAPGPAAARTVNSDSGNCDVCMICWVMPFCSGASHFQRPLVHRDSWTGQPPRSRPGSRPAHQTPGWCGMPPCFTGCPSWCTVMMYRGLTIARVDLQVDQAI